MSLTATVSTLVQPWKLVLSQSLSPFALRSSLRPLISLMLCCSHCSIMMGSHGQKLTCGLHPVTPNTQYILAGSTFSIKLRTCSSPSNTMDTRLPLPGFVGRQGDVSDVLIENILQIKLKIFQNI